MTFDYQYTEFDLITYDLTGSILEWKVYSDILIDDVPIPISWVQKNYPNKFKEVQQEIQLRVLNEHDEDKLKFAFYDRLNYYFDMSKEMQFEKDNL